MKVTQVLKQQLIILEYSQVSKKKHSVGHSVRLANYNIDEFMGIGILSVMGALSAYGAVGPAATSSGDDGWLLTKLRGLRSSSSQVHFHHGITQYTRTERILHPVDLSRVKLHLRRLSFTPISRYNYCQCQSTNVPVLMSFGYFTSNINLTRRLSLMHRISFPFHREEELLTSIRSHFSRDL